MAEPYTFPSKWKAKTDPIGLEKSLKKHNRLQRKLRERGLDKAKPMPRTKKLPKSAGPLDKLAKAEKSVKSESLGSKALKILGGTERAVERQIALGGRRGP